MKLIVAIIRPEKLPQVVRALESIGIFPMTVLEVRGRGEQKGLTITYDDREFKIELLPKIRLEIAVDDKNVEKVITVIQKAAWTGKPGDGKIFVIPLFDVVRIRTGERGVRAL